LLQLNSDKFHAFRDFFEFSRKVKSYKSRDPHHDFLRPLHVSDSQGLTAKDDLNLSEIKFFNLQSEDTPGWKDFGSRRTGSDFHQAAGLFVETLKPGTQVHIQVGLDEFLLSEQGAKAAGLPRDSNLLSFDAIAQVMNKHAFRMAASEKAFFSNYATATSGTARFYKELLDRITKTADGGFYLRMAWGSGWRGMTGNWMDDELIERVRKVKRLGKITNQGKIFPVFPKSRRLAMHDGMPLLPLGWIHVRPAEKHLFRSIATSRIVFEATTKPQSRPDIPIGSSPGSPSLPKQTTPLPPPKDPETERLEAVTEFERSLPKRNMLPSEMDRLIESINRKDDEETRRRCCEALLRFAQTDAKGFKKAKNGGKQWAVKLAELCTELGVAVS
jgi:CRISPR-associated protein Csm5